MKRDWSGRTDWMEPIPLKSVPETRKEPSCWRIETGVSVSRFWAATESKKAPGILA